MAKEGYNAFVENITRNYSGKNVQYIKNILMSEDVKDSYRSLESGNVPKSKINKVFIDAISEIEQKDNKCPEEFVSNLSKNLAKTGEHETVLNDFFDKGLLGKKDFEQSKENLKQRPRRANYVKLVMVGSFFIAVIFLIKSATNLDLTQTVAGIGNEKETIDLNVLYGTIFLVLSLAFVHFYYRKGEAKIGERITHHDYIKSILLISFIFAGYFLFKSLTSGNYIGAVLGGGVIDLDVIYGTLFLLFGLAVSHFYLNRQ